MSSTNSHDSPNKESVAVIGGGIAGLSCANALAASGKFLPTVFDTGRLRPGGRCSSRLPMDRPKDSSHVSSSLWKTTSIVDHAAQILTVPPDTRFQNFQKQVQQWEQQGILKKFPTGTVCNIVNHNDKGQQESFVLKSLNTDETPMYYGVGGMGSIPLAMASNNNDVCIEQDVWVSPSNGVQYNAKQKHPWRVQANGKTLGTFDRLVIAHNGKCADRLMSRTPAKALHSLLQVNFAPTVPAWGGKRMTLNSIYSLTFCLPCSKDHDDDHVSPLSKVLPANRFVSGFIQNEPNLRFLSCQTRKYPTARDDVEVWTVLSSAKFGKQYKGPQENLPDDLMKNVTQLLLGSLERSLTLPAGSLQDSILESRLQLWGAAVPLNTWSSSTTTEKDGFVYDSEFGVGVCGDWLLEPSIAGAWESGRRLAEYMASGDSQSIGLPPNGGTFQISKAVARAGIGSLS